MDLKVLAKNGNEAYLDYDEGEIKITFALSPDEGYAGMHKGMYLDGEPECFIKALDMWVEVDVKDVLSYMGCTEYELEHALVEAVGEKYSEY